MRSRWETILINLIGVLIMKWLASNCFVEMVCLYIQCFISSMSSLPCDCVDIRGMHAHTMNIFSV